MVLTLANVKALFSRKFKKIHELCNNVEGEIDEKAIENARLVTVQDERSTVEIYLNG